MQTSRKRQLIERTDYRARSPKRRKFGTTTNSIGSESSVSSPQKVGQNPNQEPEYSTRDISWQEQLTLPERFREAEGVWPARAILQERGKGARKEYRVEWEPHPITDETFEPTWVPRNNVGKQLIDPWEEAKKPKRASDLTYEPTQASQSIASPPDPRKASSPAPRARAKRPRPTILDLSSDIDTSDIASSPLADPPGLYRESESSAEDEVEPPSPSLEILETQAHSSISTSDYPQNFTLEVPAFSVYQSSKDSASAAQTQPSKSKSQSESLSLLDSLPRSRTEAVDQPSLCLNPVNTQEQHSIHPTQSGLTQPPNNPSDSIAQVQIAASSEHGETQPHFASSAPVIQESPADVRFEVGEVDLDKLYDDTVRRLSNSGQDSEKRDVEVRDLAKLHSTARSSSPGEHVVQLEVPPSPEPIIPGLPQTQGPTSSQVTSSPWPFESQLPEIRRAVNSPPTKFRRQEDVLNPFGAVTPKKMDVPTLRQSPRLQAATPVSRTRSPQRAQQLRRARTPQAFGETANADAISANAVTSPLATAPPHIADYTSPGRSELSYRNDGSETLAQAQMYDPNQVSALPIQQSIEEEPSSATSIASKASSSQASLLNERVIPQIDGVSLPTQPVVGPGEYLVGLPAEGKIQSVYNDHINSKRKLILKFIHRRGSVGSANSSTSRTVERNEMIELMELLQDTTTHMDLGLPGFTQYSIRSEEEMAYAEYAGSKFVFLGELVKMLNRVDCTLVIACKQGPVQDLLAEYLAMRQIQVRRHDRPPSARAGTPEALRDTLKVDIVSTTAESDVHLSAPPVLMIAFDSSFDSQAPHIRRMRELHSKGRNQPLAVIHLLVTNSAEHVDRCLRKAMPSPQRLKLLVRGTYLARTHLGGDPSYVPYPEDQPSDHPMSLHDLQRAIRKSPNRKLQMVAAIVARAALSADFEENWTLSHMPEVNYDELDDTPPKMSENTTAAGTAAPTPRDGRMRTRSPASRSATPMGRKRMLDVDAASSILHKRQRLTPMRDVTPTRDTSQEQTRLESMHEQLKAMVAELAAEKKARLEAEEARDAVKVELTKSQAIVQQWQDDHGSLMRRYERQREINRTLYKENKRLTATNENVKMQSEKLRDTNVKIRGENAQLKKDLADARTDLTSTGGDIAALETARAEARTNKDRVQTLERSLENTKRDFEFTRQQYQQASNQALDLSTTNGELEAQMEQLKLKASDEQRRLKEMNNADRENAALREIEKLREENRGLEVVLKKLEAENAVLKKGRGVQTRGSSAQPPNSPGLGGFHNNRRSRQASPAVGVNARQERNLAVPTNLGRDRD